MDIKNMIQNSFESRHIGVNDKDIAQMLEAIGVGSVDELIQQTIPSSILKKEDLKIDNAVTEEDYLSNLKKIASKNSNFDNYIGQGYYGTITPSVIKRNILCNPGWYTAYTPYQAEIAQGRLEALLNFQTFIIDLTGMELANASLLDESYSHSIRAFSISVIILYVKAFSALGLLRVIWPI